MRVLRQKDFCWAIAYLPTYVAIGPAVAVWVHSNVGKIQVLSGSLLYSLAYVKVNVIVKHSLYVKQTFSQKHKVSI